MANLPTVFRQTGEQVILNFDWTDLASGTGYVIYYLMKEGNGEYYLIDGTEIYSHDIITSEASPSDGIYKQQHSNDFDVLFKTTRNIKGKAFLCVPIDGEQYKAYLSGSLYHYDGSTETLIAQSDAHLDPFSTSSTSPPTNVQTVAFDISDRVHFAAGDILRLRCQIWGGRQSGGTAATIVMGHDPKNRTVPAANMTKTSDMTITQSSLHIPFDIDL